MIFQYGYSFFHRQNLGVSILKMPAKVKKKMPGVSDFSKSYNASGSDILISDKLFNH
jgi:hypothetical protein